MSDMFGPLFGLLIWHRRTVERSSCLAVTRDHWSHGTAKHGSESSRNLPGHSSIAWQITSSSPLLALGDLSALLEFTRSGYPSRRSSWTTVGGWRGLRR